MSERRSHVAVIIVGFRNSRDICDCLTALARATPNPSFDIFICENGGNESFYALNDVLVAQGICGKDADTTSVPLDCLSDKFAEVRRLALKGRSSRVWIACATHNLGYAGGINAWIERLQTITDWDGLWILNPDTEPYPDALFELVRHAAARNKGMVGGTILPGNARDHVHLRALRWSRLWAKSVAIGFHDPISAACDVDAIEASMDCPGGASLYVTRACVDGVGLMDDRFFLYYEDLDWGIRAKKCGLGYAVASIVSHKGGTTIGSSSASRKDKSELSVYFTSRNQILFIRKHYPWVSIPGGVLAIGYAVLYLLAGSPGNFRVAVRGILAGWAGEVGPSKGSYNDHLRTILAKLRIALYRKVKLVVSLAYFGVRAVWSAAVHVLGLPPPSRLTILCYHNVPDEYRFEFASQMDMLRRTAHVVSADFEGKLPSKSDSIAITFDDAFESVARNALPELARRSFHSTIFVPVGLIGKVPNWFAEQAAAIFDEPVMTTCQLKALPPSLVTLGSHSTNHLHISQISAKQAEYELGESRQTLAKLIERDVDLFAFPYGAYNEPVIEMCKSAGYKHVFTTVPTHVDTEKPSFVRGRVKVDPSDSRIEFFLKIKGAYMWTTAVRSVASKLTRAVSPRFGTVTFRGAPGQNRNRGSSSLN